MSKKRLIAALLCAMSNAAPASALDLLENTRLSNARIGSSFDSLLRKTARGGYELQNGQSLSFGDWYDSERQAIELAFETQLTPGSWLTWGFSTGERGEKYQIQPSLLLGYERTWALEKNAFLTFGISARFGGRLKEDPCEATYSLAVAPTKVNCRLAATTLRPDETLDYLWDEPPSNQFQMRAGYIVYF
jgi:hypothetical protein